MWKLLSKDPPYFTMFLEENEDSYYIGVTNFQQYWSKQTSRSNLLQELKQSNEGIEFDDDTELLARGIDMLKNPDSLKSVRFKHKQKDEELNVLMTKSFEITMRLDVSLLKGSPQSLFEMVVQPLLQTICDLRSSQDELRHLLLKKDREIEEYKIEGKAPRRLITTVYNDADHMMRHTTYEEFFSAPNVPDILKSVADSRNTESSRKTPLRSSASSSSTSSSRTGINSSNVSHSKTIKTEPSSQSNGPSESSSKNIPPLENGSNISTDKIKNETTEIIPKIEKSRENSLPEQTSLILPPKEETLQNDVEVKLSPKVEVRQTEEISPARKKHRKRLNY